MTPSFTLLVVTPGVRSTDPMVAEQVLRLYSILLVVATALGLQQLLISCVIGEPSGLGCRLPLKHH